MSNELKVARVAAPLRQQVINNLRNAIIGGELVPGERLIERELCEKVGVSRTLIREALRQLEAEGLVSVVAHKGPSVRAIGRDEAAQLYEVRAVLEGLLAKLVAEKSTTSEKKAIRAEYAKMVAGFEKGGASRLITDKNAFYERLMAACDNIVLQEQLRQLHARISLLRSLSLNQPGRAAKSLVEIKALVLAIERGDGKAAWDASVAHVEAAGAIVLSVLKDDEHEAAE